MNSGVKAAMVLPVVLAAGSLWGQKWVAPETAMTGNGEFEFGYSGGYGNAANSNENSVYVGLLGGFQGYYRDPRVLSFSVAPNWRWDTDSSADTSFGANNENVFSTLRFLGGSDAPLTINYDVNRITLANLTGGEVPITVRSRGLSQNLNINWSIHKHERNKADRWPTLMLSYGKGWSDNSVSGVEAPSLSSDSSTFMAQSLYQIAGFHLTGTFTHQDITQSNPNLLDLGLATQTKSKSQSESVSLTRNFFKNTSVAASYATSKGDVDVLNTPSNTSFDTANASVNMRPVERLDVNGSVNYISNESSQVLSSLATGTPPTTSGGTGGVVPQLLLSTGREVDGNANASYVLSQTWQLLGGASRVQSDLLGGIRIDNDNFFGGILFSHRVGRGFLSAAYTPGYFTVDERATDSGQEVKLQGFMNGGQVRYARQIGRWRGNGGFTYSQSDISQPTVIPLISRSVSGNLSASTQIAHEWNFTGTYVTAWSQYAGANSSLSNSVSASIGNRTWNFMGQYQYNSGYSVATPFGLVPVTGTGGTTTGTGTGTGDSVLTSSFFTTADGFAASASYRRRRLQVTGTYTRNFANVTSPLQAVNSGSSTFNALAEYRFRRIKIRAGFLRFGENISGNTALNQSANTYYVSLVRPFHIF